VGDDEEKQPAGDTERRQGDAESAEQPVTENGEAQQARTG
jgi:hypothetical protein